MRKALSLFILLTSIAVFNGFIMPSKITAQENPQEKATLGPQAEIEAKKQAQEKARITREKARELAETTKEPGIRKKTLVFAGNDKFAPYSYFPEQALSASNAQQKPVTITVIEEEPAGYSVDLIKILSATINKDISIKLMPWQKCLSELKAGNADGLIGIPVYKKREKYVDYSEPVAEVDFAIFVETSNRYVNSLKSLRGTVVGVHKDSLIIDELQKDKRIKLLETETIPDALHKLKNKEVTAVIAEKGVALFYIQQKNIRDIKIVGPPVGPVYEYALAVREGKKELLEEINHGIITLRKNGTLEKLKRKWFGLYLMEPFPWKMVSAVIGGITGILLVLMGLLWVTSLNATVKMKTEQIQTMSQKMVEKDKLAVLGKLAGQIAHELRTPLSIINNSVFLLRKEGSENRELFEKRLRMLEDKIKLSSNILESILSYSRVKAEMATTIPVKECVEAVLKDMDIPEDIEKEISFEKDESLMVFMDFHQLYSVIRNLILNSLQAMGARGKLAIKVFSSDDDSNVNIRICDTGHGIIESVQNKIFNLFYSSKITGTGLGLPISKSIIEANGGQLYLEETSEKGTCFIVKLPSPKTSTK
jgi:signal transduction histidine kinase